MVAGMVLRAFVTVWIGIAVAAHALPARADAAEVEALIAKGNDLRRAGRPGQALPYFQKAYELARTPRTTGQLGLAELAAGYPVEAAEHLAIALEAPANDPAIAKFRQMLVDALAIARSHIGELAISGSPAGAEVVVNGRVVGALPLASTVKLAASDSEVVVRAPGYGEHRESVRVAVGQRRELTVNLEKVAKPAEPTVVATPAPPPPVNPPPPPLAPPAAAASVVAEPQQDAASSGAKLRTAAWIFGGAAVIAGGTGLAFQLAARSKLDEFNGSCKETPTIQPVAGGSLSQPECEDRHDAWQSYKRWSFVGYGAGAALAITSGILFWTSRPDAPDANAHAHVTCTPTPNGLSCQGVF